VPLFAQSAPTGGRYPGKMWGVLRRAVLLLALIVADLALWVVWLVGAMQENRNNGVSRFGCSSFAQDVAAPLAVVGIVVIVGVLIAFADRRRVQG
jgi:hypothetical protein